MLGPREIQRIQESFQKHATKIAFEELTRPTPIDPIGEVLMQKAASVADRRQFLIALELSPEDPYTTYERMGGQYNAEK